MKHIELHFTGAVLCFLLFSAAGAQPLSILKIIEGLQSPPQTYSTPLYSFSLCMEITNRVLTDSLLNTTSQQYKQMYNQVYGVLDLAFNCSNCDTRETYRGVTDIRFRSIGAAMIANCTIQFQTIFINHVVIKYLFLRAIDNNTQPNGLTLNRQFTADTVTPVWLFPKSTTPMATAAPFAGNAGHFAGNAAHSAGSGFHWLPGWAIALLVLSCFIILLLLIIILLLICCWPCRRKVKKEETTNIVEHAPYQRTSFKEHLANPTYMAHTPESSPIYPVLQGEPELQHGSQAGMYAMNPQR